MLSSQIPPSGTPRRDRPRDKSRVVLIDTPAPSARRLRSGKQDFGRGTMAWLARSSSSPSRGAPSIKEATCLISAAAAELKHGDRPRVNSAERVKGAQLPVGLQYMRIRSPPSAPVPPPSAGRTWWLPVGGLPGLVQPHSILTAASPLEAILPLQARGGPTAVGCTSARTCVRPL